MGHVLGILTSRAEEGKKRQVSAGLRVNLGPQDSKALQGLCLVCGKDKSQTGKRSCSNTHNWELWAHSRDGEISES